MMCRISLKMLIDSYLKILEMFESSASGCRKRSQKSRQQCIWFHPQKVYAWSQRHNVTFFFLPYWDLNSGPTPWATPPDLFCEEFFQNRVSWTICLSRLWTSILLISASWVAKSIGMSHQCLAIMLLLKINMDYASAS
jgi:hypothetical protein